MLKFESDQGAVSLECRGQTLEVVADLGAVIADIYGQLRGANAGAAEEFRKMLHCILEPDSPVWSHNPPVGPNNYTVIIPAKKK